MTKVPAANSSDASKSFSVETDVKRSEATIRSYLADSTPTIVVNGKFRLQPSSAGGAQQSVDLALWLVQQELRK